MSFEPGDSQPEGHRNVAEQEPEVMSKYSQYDFKPAPHESEARLSHPWHAMKSRLSGVAKGWKHSQWGKNLDSGLNADGSGKGSIFMNRNSSGCNVNQFNNQMNYNNNNNKSSTNSGNNSNNNNNSHQNSHNNNLTLSYSENKEHVNNSNYHYYYEPQQTPIPGIGSLSQVSCYSNQFYSPPTPQHASRNAPNSDAFQAKAGPRPSGMQGSLKPPYVNSSHGIRNRTQSFGTQGSIRNEWNQVNQSNQLSSNNLNHRRDKRMLSPQVMAKQRVSMGRNFDKNEHNFETHDKDLVQLDAGQRHFQQRRQVHMSDRNGTASNGNFLQMYPNWSDYESAGSTFDTESMGFGATTDTESESKRDLHVSKANLETAGTDEDNDLDMNAPSEGKFRIQIENPDGTSSAPYLHASNASKRGTFDASELEQQLKQVKEQRLKSPNLVNNSSLKPPVTCTALSSAQSSGPGTPGSMKSVPGGLNDKSIIIVDNEGKSKLWQREHYMSGSETPRMNENIVNMSKLECSVDLNILQNESLRREARRNKYGSTTIYGPCGNTQICTPQFEGINIYSHRVRRNYAEAVYTMDTPRLILMLHKLNDIDCEWTRYIMMRGYTSDALDLRDASKKYGVSSFDLFGTCGDKYCVLDSVETIMKCQNNGTYLDIVCNSADLNASGAILRCYHNLAVASCVQDVAKCARDNKEFEELQKKMNSLRKQPRRRELEMNIVQCMCDLSSEFRRIHASEVTKRCSNELNTLNIDKKDFVSSLNQFDALKREIKLLAPAREDLQEVRRRYVISQKKDEAMVRWCDEYFVLGPRPFGFEREFVASHGIKRVAIMRRASGLISEEVRDKLEEEYCVQFGVKCVVVDLNNSGTMWSDYGSACGSKKDFDLLRGLKQIYAEHDDCRTWICYENGYDRHALTLARARLILQNVNYDDNNKRQELFFYNCGEPFWDDINLLSTLAFGHCHSLKFEVYTARFESFLSHNKALTHIESLYTLYNEYFQEFVSNFKKLPLARVALNPCSPIECYDKFLQLQYEQILKQKQAINS